MFGKRVRFMMVLFTAVGMSYAWFSENVAGMLKTKWEAIKSRSSSLSTNGGDGMSGWQFLPNGDGSPGIASPANAAPPIHSLANVLRFDVDARWVTQQWGRVSTVHADQGLEGLRVALVTGTNRSDVTGALTYYFDAQHRVRRITLTGQTGDERALVEIVGRQFGLRPEPTLGAGLYVRRWNGQPKNALRVSHAPIVRSDSPFGQLSFELELNDLGAHYGLSSQFAQVVR